MKWISAVLLSVTDRSKMDYKLEICSAEVSVWLNVACVLSTNSALLWRSTSLKMIFLFDNFWSVGQRKPHERDILIRNFLQGSGSHSAEFMRWLTTPFLIDRQWIFQLFKFERNLFGFNWDARYSNKQVALFRTHDSAPGNCDWNGKHKECSVQ